MTIIDPHALSAVRGGLGALLGAAGPILNGVAGIIGAAKSGKGGSAAPPAAAPAAAGSCGSCCAADDISVAIQVGAPQR